MEIRSRTSRFYVKVLFKKYCFYCIIQGLKTAASYFVGSEIIGQTPDIWIKYDSNYWKTFTEDYKTSDRLDHVINWIHKFNLDLTFLYISEPVSLAINLFVGLFQFIQDSHGHLYGPESEEYLKKVSLKE